MNNCNEPLNQNFLQDDMEEWVVDLKKVYDICQDMLRMKN
jgi:hypothetical protein